MPGLQVGPRVTWFPRHRAGADDIEQGLLVCAVAPCPIQSSTGSHACFPIHFDVIRFARDLREIWRASRFVHGPPDARHFEQFNALTARTFRYEWNTYKTTSRRRGRPHVLLAHRRRPRALRQMPLTDVFTYYPTADEVAHIDPAQIAGQRVLEVGCGMGKYLKVASEHAAEVIGMDLSDSLQRAQHETRDRPNVHLVQGDILYPPLRRQSMDFVYSVGVLHHTPDCHRAFLRCASLVAPGGLLAVWLYPADPTPGSYAEWAHWLQDDFLRPVTCRLPLWALRGVSAGLGRLTFVRDRYAERFRATGSRLALRVAMAAGALAVGRHHDQRSPPS